MVRKADLQKEIDRLNEDLAKSGKNKIRESTYFILLNSNETTRNEVEVESSKQYMIEIVRYLGEHLYEVIDFRDRNHTFSDDYIVDANIKFALEQSKGRRKKDGTYSQYAGQVHAHALLTIRHKSNIILNNQKMIELLQPQFEYYYGHGGFVSSKWIPSSKIEDYMTKSKEYAGGHKWTKL